MPLVAMPVQGPGAIAFDSRAGLERLQRSDLAPVIPMTLLQFAPIFYFSCQARERFCCGLRSTESPIRRFGDFLNQ